MKLLFDENLSPRLVGLLAAEFPNSSHVEILNMRGTTDLAIWEFAREHNFIIVSKDNDFRQRVFLYGPPPKVIWLSIGNAGTSVIAKLLRKNLIDIQSFAQYPEEGLLVLKDAL